MEYSFLKEEKPSVTDVLSIEGNSLTNDEKEELKASASLRTRETEEKKGIYKNIDLYKMHAYKDAIRRSGGAYILYPGNTESETNFNGFHEIIPGIGAFALRPNNEGIASKNIEQFIDKVIANLEDVLSQRERMAKSAGRVYANKPEPIIDKKLDALIRDLHSSQLPDKVQVLVGYFKNETHKKWIESKKSYNI